MKYVLVILFLVLSSMGVWAETSNLEKLFIDGKYTDFFLQAEALAKSNNVEALFLLGKAYHLGKGVEVDIPRAKKLYTTSSQLGSARAMHNLGYIAMESDFYDEQYDQAVYYYENALEMGFETPTKANLLIAYNKLAKLCEKAGGCKRTDVSQLYKKSADIYADFYAAKPTDENLDPVMTSYAEAYASIGDTSNQEELRALAMKWLNLGISRNLPNAMHNMGAIYYYVDKDVEKAREWFKKGADRGLGISAYALATTYSEHGTGKLDKAVADRLYEKAFSMGSEHSAKKICGEHAQNARTIYSGSVREKYSQYGKALDCFMTPVFSKYSWAKAGVQDAVNNLRDLTYDIEELERIQKKIDGAQKNCNCEFDGSELRLKLNTLKLYKANFEDRDIAMLPGNFEIRIPASTDIGGSGLALVSVPPHSNSDNLILLSSDSGLANGGKKISVDTATSNKIRAAMKKGNTILLMHSFIDRLYFKYTPCDNKPCLVPDERQVGNWVWAYADAPENANLSRAKHSCSNPEVYETGECKLLLHKKSKDDADTQYNLGVKFRNGRGVPKDIVKAIQWYQKAAEKGHRDAQFNLGEIYFNGRDVAKDEKLALNWLLKAAAQGSQDAQHFVGYMYENGVGTVVNIPQAVKWHLMAAEQGDVNSQFDLANIYYFGKGALKDERLALSWNLKAAEQGHAVAQSNVGEMYRNGEGVARDDLLAIAWYRKSVAQNNVHGQFNLGEMYEAGRGVTEDKVQAFQLFKKAAEQASAEAQLKLGRMYENGQGVKKNNVLALQWYSKALKNGSAVAMDEIERFKKANKGVVLK